MSPPTSMRLGNLRFCISALLISAAASLLPDAVGKLWPALVALFLVFTTRNAPLSLATACLSAIVLLLLNDPSGLAQWSAPEGALWKSLLSPWHIYALVFTLLLGALASLIERGGGLLRLLPSAAESSPRSRRRFLTGVYGLGLLCFFDGLANALMLGRVTRPLADRLRIPRAFLAYLVDTTSSAVACLAFLSTWIVTQLAYISEHSPLDDPPYLQYLSSIPLNFYCLFALLVVLLAVQADWRIGPMSRQEPVQGRKPDDLPALPSRGTLASAVVPVVVLLVTLPSAILFLHPFQKGHSLGEHLQQALNAPTVPIAFVLASGIGVLTAFALYPGQRRRESPAAALHGVYQLLPAVVILVLAWILGSLFKVLETTDVLSATLGSWLPLAFLPAGVFLSGCLISFISGTSWGTMGLLMPLALPLAGGMAASQGVPPESLGLVVPGVIGAVFGGAVFGDHCSPYSDTTIVSALACGISTHQHTVTQLPYALLTAGGALLFGYLPVALGLPAVVTLIIAGGLLTLVVVVTAQRRHGS